MQLASILSFTVSIVFFAGCAGYPPVQMAPGNTSQAAAQVREGIIELKNGEYESARERFETALFLDQKPAEAHYNLAIVLDEQGKPADAMQHLKDAATLAHGNPAIVQSDFYVKQVKGSTPAPR